MIENHLYINASEAADSNKNSTPLFSVIIPTYNRAKELEKCLDSLLAQSYKNFEVLVCDDGSADHTKEIANVFLKRGLDLHYFYQENWGGPAKPRNIGIQNARADWICFLDSDDWWTPDKLEVCLPYLENNDIIFHSLQIFSERNGLQNKYIRGRKPASPVFLDLLENGNCGSNSSAVVRRSIVEQTGLISEEKELIAIEDFDYWLRISRVTERFCFIPKILGYYRVSDSSISSNEKQVQKHINLYEKHLVEIFDKKMRHEIEARQAYRNARGYASYSNALKAQEHYKIALQTKHLFTKLKTMIFYMLNKKI
jgi:glycosyltransferase involved in cell wall biosynthesis